MRQSQYLLSETGSRATDRRYNNNLYDFAYIFNLPTQLFRSDLRAISEMLFTPESRSMSRSQAWFFIANWPRQKKMKETKVAKRYFAPSLNVAASILSKGVFHRRLSTQCGLNKITFLCDKQLLLNYKFTVLARRSPYFLWLLHSIKLNCFGNWSRLATCQSFLHCGRHFSAFILLDGFNSQLFIIITKANKPTQTQKSGSVTIKRVGWAWASEIIGAGSLSWMQRPISNWPRPRGDQKP